MGILSTITSSLSPKTATSPPTKPDVIVIGAGVSGLAAAATLVKAGKNVLVLEARDRIGGRTYTYTDPAIGVPMDLGGSFIHGLAGNPLEKLARENKLKLYAPKSKDGSNKKEMFMYSPDGPSLPQELTEKLGFNSMKTMFGSSEEVAQESSDSIPSDYETLASYIIDNEDSSLYQGLKSETERKFARQLAQSWDGWMGARLDQVSLKYWQADVTYDGPDATVVDGYKGIYEPLAATVRAHAGSSIKLDSPVIALAHNEEKDIVRISVQSPCSIEGQEQPVQEYSAPYVICTIPLGVLQKHPPKFTPPLALRRREAINRLGMGLLNKIIVTYPNISKPFWPEEAHFVVMLPSAASQALLPVLKDRALMAQSYKPVTGKNTLVFYLGAQAGEEVEDLSDEQVRIGIHAVLKYHFGDHPDFPKHEKEEEEEANLPSVIVTRWLRDPYSCGSYSYMRPASKEDDKTAVPTPYDFAELARPAWGNRLFFAGEATDPDHYATVHGPYITGLKEAQRVLDAMEAETYV